MPHFSIDSIIKICITRQDYISQKEIYLKYISETTLYDNVVSFIGSLPVNYVEPSPFYNCSFQLAFTYELKNCPDGYKEIQRSENGSIKCMGDFDYIIINFLCDQPICPHEPHEGS